MFLKTAGALWHSSPISRANLHYLALAWRYLLSRFVQEWKAKYESAIVALTFDHVLLCLLKPSVGWSDKTEREVLRWVKNMAAFWWGQGDLGEEGSSDVLLLGRGRRVLSGLSVAESPIPYPHHTQHSKTRVSSCCLLFGRPEVFGAD